MASKAANHFMYNMMNDYFSGKTIKALAIASDGAFDPGASDYDNLDDISASITSYEFDGTNYARITLASVTVTESDANDNAVLDAADATISDLAAGTNPIEGWLFYVDGASDTDRKVIAWFEYASPQTPNGSDFTVQIAATGILSVSQAA